MADKDLQVINSSGELTEIKLGGTGSEKVVLTKEQVDALFGDYSFNLNLMLVDDNVIIEFEADQLNLGGDVALLHFVSPSIESPNLTIAIIDAGGSKMVPTKEWVQAEIAKHLP